MIQEKVFCLRCGWSFEARLAIPDAFFCNGREGVD